MTESENRLQLLGAQALTDAELLAVLFGEGSARTPDQQSENRKRVAND